MGAAPTWSIALLGAGVGGRRRSPIDIGRCV
ncbi:hypothetical protein [Streptomyces sp. NPDC008240]